jgi:hypothetical protein
MKRYIVEAGKRGDFILVYPSTILRFTASTVSLP